MKATNSWKALIESDMFLPAQGSGQHSASVEPAKEVHGT